MLYIGCLIIVNGQNIKNKKKGSKISILALQRVQNCISRWGPSPFEAAAPPLQKPKWGEKHTKRV